MNNTDAFVELMKQIHERFYSLSLEVEDLDWREDCYRLAISAELSSKGKMLPLWSDLPKNTEEYNLLNIS